MNIPPRINSTSELKEWMLNSKALPPLETSQIDELERIAALDVTSYSEADIRAEIIDPVIRILGYQKETYFSLHREKSLKVLAKDLFIDYSMTLWSENFWVIEAKKVKRKSLGFVGADLIQGMQYATHPDINAALVVLCDGKLFEVYDREESVTSPIARVEVKDLPEQFDVLRGLLSPWQAWFFQKRRVLRLIDKVFDYEINQGRVREFGEAVERRLIEKRGRILENWRKVNSLEADSARHLQRLQDASTADLVDLHFFICRSNEDMGFVASTLADRAAQKSFEIMYAIFPDDPRDTNDNYWACALKTLLKMEQQSNEVNWMPSYLSNGPDSRRVSGAVQRLIALGLDTFDADRSRKLILQYSASARRVAKLLMALMPGITQLGEMRHLQIRQSLDELELAQFLSSPEGQNLRQLEVLEMVMTAKFCQKCKQAGGAFNVALAQSILKKSWATERALLKDGSAYRDGLEAHQLKGEFNATEHNWVDYDSIGHIFLCVLAHSPKWRDYVLQAHHKEVQRIAAYGSWQAKELLGMSIDAEVERATSVEIAHRFFDGDEALLKALSSGYSVRSAHTSDHLTAVQQACN
jgi:hypothetical protein